MTDPNNPKRCPSLQAFLAKLEDNASDYENPQAFWESVSLLFAIWTSGGIPAAGYDPNYNRSLMPLFDALRKFGDSLHKAVDARVFQQVSA